jgi:hypothetical protein
MKKFTLLAACLALCAAMFFTTSEAEARTITVKNEGPSKLWVALVLPNMIDGGNQLVYWYGVGPWATRRLNFEWAGGNWFGYFAYTSSYTNSNICTGKNAAIWRGKDSIMRLPVVQSKSGNLSVKKAKKSGRGCPVNFAIKRGNVITFSHR